MFTYVTNYTHSNAYNLAIYKLNSLLLGYDHSESLVKVDFFRENCCNNNRLLPVMASVAVV